MRISLLLNREPFGEIVTKTLSSFFSEKLQGTYSVKWHSRKNPKKIKLGSQLWICNPYINAIFHPDVRYEVLSPVIKEFSTSISPWKRLFQKTYVLAASTKPTNRWLATYSIAVAPPIQTPEKYVVLGGNHHIRIIDDIKNCCYVICKDGFNSGFIRRELDIRQKHPIIPVPAILEIGKDSTWYSEELISGTPINRLTNPEKSASALAKVSVELKRLYIETQHTVSLTDYVQTLIEEILTISKSNPLFSNDYKEKVRKLSHTLYDFLRKSHFNELDTVQSHGDFQPANILIDDTEKTWLIDWEYTKPRQADYDFLVYSLKSRFPEGLLERIRFILKMDPFPEKEIANISSRMWSDKSARSFLISIFLLEEIALRLMEQDTPGLFQVHPGFRSFLKEAEQAAVLIAGAT